MQLTWFGTAGFQIVTHGHTILIDPYFTRNPKAVPRQRLTPSDIRTADGIFVSHGHFDHIFDIPEIVANTGAAVYCGTGIDTTLVQKGVGRDRLHCVHSDGQTFCCGHVAAQAFFSTHVRFDNRLLIKALARMHFRLPGYLPLSRQYPQGQTLSWRFTIEGKVVHHFGSAGSTASELDRLGQHPTDILLVPLQGHTHITQIAHAYVKALQPKRVIPHHQDNFFPPISTRVDPQPFEKLVKKTHPDTRVQVLEMNQCVSL